MGLQWKLKLLVTLNDVCFAITHTHILIPTKPWFRIMGLDPPYHIFPTDNSFRNPWQSIRVHSIWLPLYLSKYLYRVVRRHMCPQYHPKKQGYFPVQVPKHWVSPESTQGWLGLWSLDGMTSSPLPHHRIISVSQCWCVGKTCR